MRAGCMKKIITIVVLVSFVFSLPDIALAGDDQMGFTSYFFSDSGENSVVTTSFSLAKKVLHQTALLLDIELDQVTVPAVTAVTGATRPQRHINEPYEKSRGQVILGMEQGLGQTTTFAANVYRSQETDYISTSAIATLSQELYDRNTTVTLRGQYNADLVGKIHPDGSLENQRKKVYTGTLNISQILSPTTVFDLGYDYVYLHGYLSDPYRQVKVINSFGETVTTDELHPAKRTRQAVSGKITQMIAPVKASVIGSYRYYFDSWKVKSHTAEIRLNKYILNDLVFGVNYRYYAQNGAYFTLGKYAGDQFLANDFRTADYKLKKFGSNNFGFSLEYLLRGLGNANPDLEFLQNSSVEVMYFRYFNDLNFTADIVQVAVKVSI
jgi:hypothetical protein